MLTTGLISLCTGSVIMRRCANAYNRTIRSRKNLELNIYNGLVANNGLHGYIIKHQLSPREKYHYIMIREHGNWDKIYHEFIDYKLYLSCKIQAKKCS